MAIESHPFGLPNVLVDGVLHHQTSQFRLLREGDFSPQNKALLHFDAARQNFLTALGRFLENDAVSAEVRSEETAATVRLVGQLIELMEARRGQ